ncbi:sulfite exporter TauE/SafE family protein [Cytophagaceae bacterium YF14B1]|uniref:Probable membrane transporter protein n=1 Tax=Xanthocytophaga flava TaxID=3048013 RepID=A0AAE3QWJ4_9BACT|nr:sulfite exporter TauE/SafE family protein [Xanthocytophaga flavus]MDJ1484805.1 sulfite exporter TauE/SafE family protein [Xanthocytophaga flavus]
METIGYLGALLMGMSLGLIGGGGSILTVPILVYLFAIDSVVATSYSLFIVGLTSLIGSFSHISRGNIHWRAVVLFGIPSLLSVYTTRHLIVPLIPETLGTIGHFIVTKSIFLLIFFAIVMLLASYSMIHKPRLLQKEEQEEASLRYPVIILEGILVGGITGLVGAGGGFLIVPALVLLTHLSMKQAIGTSLVIIALNALVGFIGSLHWGDVIDWKFLLVFSAISLVGILIGSRLSFKISSTQLKPAFGWFVLVMGLYIIVKELFLK